MKSENERKVFVITIQTLEKRIEALEMKAYGVKNSSQAMKL
jgi:hypothetical protein